MTTSEFNRKCPQCSGEQIDAPECPECHRLIAVINGVPMKKCPFCKHILPEGFGINKQDEPEDPQKLPD